jgi:hypothetical protein
VMPGRRSLAWRNSVGLVVPVRIVVAWVTSGGWRGPRVGRLPHRSSGVASTLQHAGVGRADMSS